MYKLMAIDLDGTLLNSFGEISEGTKEAIINAKKQGIEIVLASGRPISSTKTLANELGVSRYIISGNGAVIYDIKEEKIIYDRLLNKEQIFEIIKICEDNSFYYNIYTEDEVIAKSLNYNVLFYFKENAKKVEEKRTHINIVQNVPQYIEESGKNRFLKITICDESKLIFNSIMKKLKNIENIDILETEYMSRKTIKDGTGEVDIEYYFTEITNKNVNKWSAIQFLVQKLGITENEVVAIGDNLNDKEMVQNAGLGIVMGNSNPTMKELADIIVSDNNSEGVMEAIKKYILR